VPKRSLLQGSAPAPGTNVGVLVRDVNDGFSTIPTT
jgi:hypothetical protein